jgi:DNA-directed RNA polymerase beta' subunit
MNANELADKLLGSLTMEYDCDKYMEQAATMLRQQQEKLNKYELRNEEQRNRITYLEAKLSEALDAEKDRRFE